MPPPLFCQEIVGLICDGNAREGGKEKRFVEPSGSGGEEAVSVQPMLLSARSLGAADLTSRLQMLRDELAHGAFMTFGGFVALL